jgi:hypothetical protein
MDIARCRGEITVRNLLFGFLIILAAAVLTGTPGARSGSGGSAGAAANNLANAATSRNGVSCTITPVRIRKDANRVVAGGRFLCDSPGPELLNMLVHLQKQGANGKWSTIASQRVITSGKATTRGTSQGNRTREAALPCADGTYRTHVSAYTVSHGKTREFNKDTGSVKNPC